MPQSPSLIQGNLAWYFMSAEAFRPANLGKLSGRYLFYVLGPGTLAFLGYSVSRHLAEVREIWRIHRPWLLVLLAGAALYTLLFMNLNVEHNYYQLPAAFLLYALILPLCRPALRSRTGLAVLIAAIALNVALSQKRLASNKIPIGPRSWSFWGRETASPYRPDAPPWSPTMRLPFLPWRFARPLSRQ